MNIALGANTLFTALSAVETSRIILRKWLAGAEKKDTDQKADGALLHLNGGFFLCTRKEGREFPVYHALFQKLWVPCGSVEEVKD